MNLLGVKKLQENTQVEFYFVPDPPKQAGGRVQKDWLGSLLCVLEECMSMRKYQEEQSVSPLQVQMDF